MKNQRLEGANTVDQDGTAHYEQSHLDLQCLQNHLLLCLVFYGLNDELTGFIIRKITSCGHYYVIKIPLTSILYSNKSAACKHDTPPRKICVGGLVNKEMMKKRPKHSSNFV